MKIKIWKITAAFLICISTPHLVNALEPSGQRNSDTLIRFSGSVSEGQKFSRPIGNSLTFVLNPNAEGFHISIQTDQGVDVSGMATPPFHGVNDLSIDGWHFRKSDDSAMNVPGKERKFLFFLSEKYLQTVREDYQKYGNYPRGNGKLIITKMKLGNSESGQAPKLEAMDFDVELQLPKRMNLSSQSKNTREGEIFFLQTEEGISIFGEIKGSKPNFAKTAEEILTKEHLELWISSEQEIQLPLLGWVSQFGEINDKTADDCVALNSSWNENIRSKKVSECKAWFKTQFLYRDLIKKQFIRQWQIAPDIIIETYASPALKKIRSLVPAEYSEQFKTFTAKSLPTITVDEKTISDGYTFLIHVPWSSLPPQQQLELNKLKIRLDIYNSGIKGKYGPYSSTSPSPKYGQVTSFNDFQLNQPRKYKISSCDYPMNAVGINNTGKDNKENKTYYYFPDNQTLLDSVFVFENRGRGYQYSPELPSPLPSMQKTFSKQIEPGLFVCGPRLSLVKDGRSIYSELTLEPTYLKPENESIAKEVKFKKINAEDWLLTLGAGIYYSSYGSGQCGACPRHILQIFHLNSNAGFKKIMDYNSIVECTDEMFTDDEHIEVSDDLKKITMYAKKFIAKFNDGGDRLPPPWMKAEVCLKGSQYSDCYSDMVVTKKEDLKLAKTTSTPAKSVCNH